MITVISIIRMYLFFLKIAENISSNTINTFAMCRFSWKNKHKDFTSDLETQLYREKQNFFFFKAS